MSQVPPRPEEPINPQILGFPSRGRAGRPGVGAFTSPNTSGEDTDKGRMPVGGEPQDDLEPPSVLTKVAAFATVGTITAAAIWLAFSLADVRKKQDCALLGVRNCVTTTVP